MTKKVIESVNLKTLINRAYQLYCGQHIYHTDGRKYQYFPTGIGYMKCEGEPTNTFYYQDLNLEHWFIHPMNNGFPKSFKILQNIPFFGIGEIHRTNQISNKMLFPTISNENYQFQLNDKYSLEDCVSYPEFFEPIYE